MKTWRLGAGGVQADPSLGLDDRAFRYGMSFFETVAVFRGRALFLDEHIGRIVRAAGACGGKVPEDAVAAAVGGLVPSLEDGVLRIYATAGAGAPGDAFGGDVFLLHEACEVGAGFTPLRVMTSAAPFFPRPGGWKTGNYWQNIDALAAARRSGCDEALLFNPAGSVVSAAMANVFFCLDGEWVTPRLESGARDGVVRAWVCGQFGYAEADLDFSDVVRCSACFVTNSRVGIRQVAELDGRSLGLDDPWYCVYREEVLRD